MLLIVILRNNERRDTDIHALLLLHADLFNRFKISTFIFIGVLIVGPMPSFRCI